VEKALIRKERRFVPTLWEFGLHLLYTYATIVLTNETHFLLSDKIGEKAHDLKQYFSATCG